MLAKLRICQNRPGNILLNLMKSYWILLNLVKSYWILLVLFRQQFNCGIFQGKSYWIFFLIESFWTLFFHVAQPRVAVRIYDFFVVRSQICATVLRGAPPLRGRAGGRPPAVPPPLEAKLKIASWIDRDSLWGERKKNNKRDNAKKVFTSIEKHFRIFLKNFEVRSNILKCSRPDCPWFRLAFDRLIRLCNSNKAIGTP